MVLSQNELFLLRQCAVSAALQAGQLISEYVNKDIPVKSKTAGESLASQVVTEVDLLSQEIILKNIEPTCEIYDLALLTEESADDHSRLEKDYFWCIDPLDGTLPFVESTPGYAVSIALVARCGTPYIGVVYDPVEQNLYHAIKGEGAFRNGKPLELSVCVAGKKLTFVTDRSFLKHNRYNEVLTELNQFAEEKGYCGLDVIHHGGAAMNACWVLEMSPACYFKFPKPKEGGGSLWDYAATACIFEEAGAVVADIHGKPLELNREESTFMNHRGAMYASDQEIAERVMEIYK